VTYRQRITKELYRFPGCWMVSKCAQGRDRVAYRHVSVGAQRIAKSIIKELGIELSVNARRAGTGWLTARDWSARWSDALGIE
jgi:hypothetical protein